MKIGYCRVSTDDQNPDLQLTALKRAGCRTIFTDKATGLMIFDQDGQAVAFTVFDRFDLVPKKRTPRSLVN